MATVSVLIATYNRLHDLYSCLKAIDNQVGENEIEVCVVNDGGPSIRPVVERFANLRIQYRDLDTNVGQVRARNAALAMASGDYIALCDDDDRFLPHHVESLIAAVTRHGGKVTLAHTDVELVKLTRGTDDSRRLQVVERLPFAWKNPLEMLRHYNPIVPASVLYPRLVHQDVGEFDVFVGHYWDWDFWLRLMGLGEWVRAPQCQTLYGLYSNQSNLSANPLLMRHDLETLVEKHGLGELPSSNFELMLEDVHLLHYKDNTEQIWDGGAAIWQSDWTV